MAVKGRKANDQGGATVPKIVLAAIACVIALVLIVILLQIVIRNGASLIKDAGERPIETAQAEEVWSPENRISEGNDVEQVVAPTYAPNVADNADFKDAEDANAVKVIELPQEEGNLFEPEDFEEE